jgi:tetratricopeptide (TPR) repeat protein
LRAVEGALSDAEPLVRRGALEALEEADDATRRRLALPLLGDAVLDVRLQAARLLAGSVAGELEAGEGSRLRRVLAEYERAQQCNSDRVEGRLNLGWLAAWRRRPDRAEREYRSAVELAPWFAPAYVNLADLYRQLGRETEVVEVLRQGLESALETADLHHGLGLALARGGQTDAALEHLRLAASLPPRSSRYAYVYGVALNSLGRSAEALEVLRLARDDWPANRDLLIGLATISRDAGDVDDARAYARQLAELDPDDPVARQLLAELLPGG